MPYHLYASLKSNTSGVFLNCPGQIRQVRCDFEKAFNVTVQLILHSRSCQICMIEAFVCQMLALSLKRQETTI